MQLMPTNCVEMSFVLIGLDLEGRHRGFIN